MQLHQHSLHLTALVTDPFEVEPVAKKVLPVAGQEQRKPRRLRLRDSEGGEARTNGKLKRRFSDRTASSRP